MMATDGNFAGALAVAVDFFFWGSMQGAMSNARKHSPGLVEGSHALARFGSRQQLYFLFKLLGAFQLMIIGAGLLSSYRLEQHYSQALALQELCNARRHAVATLDQLANGAAMPAADDFQSEGLQQMQMQLHYAANLFMTLSGQFSDEVKVKRDPLDEVLAETAASLEPAMQVTMEQADKAFAAYQAGDQKQFEAQMIYTDRAYRRVQLALGNLRQSIFLFEEDNIRQQFLIARHMHIWNGALELLALLVVVAVVLYARQLHRQVRDDDAALLSQQEVLERNVEERTAALRSEVAERKRIEIYSRGESQLLKMVARNEPEEKVLWSLVRLMEQHRPGVGILLQLSGQLGASSICVGLPEGLGKEITSADPLENPINLAARERRMVTLDDIRSGCVSDEIKTLAQQHGIGAWWAAPIISQGDTVSGTISLFFCPPHLPLGADRDMLQAGTRMAGVVIGHRQMYDALIRQAQHDGLTGLPNRALCEDRLQQAIARAQRHQRMFAVLCLDLDGFKGVNDTYGHLTGDALLRQLAQRLAGRVRSCDTLARMGGDEFMAIVEDINSDHAVEKVATTLMGAFSEPFEIDGGELRVSASLGAAVYPGDGETPDLLQRHADHAMYRAKAQGRNRYQMFSVSMSQELAEQRSIEAELEKALANNTLEVWYQPQFTREGSLVGLEALLRFHHPALGMLLPGRFIPIAEETGLIVPIGEWVLRQVCRQSREWQRSGLKPVRIAVNVSALQFSRPDFAQVVADILHSSGIAPNLIELELTESLIMKNVQDSRLQMRSLKNLGVRISIDDFGTGHSSLSYLYQLPIDTLKIDRSFVEHITEPSGTSTIVEAIIGLARKLGLDVVGEGVETGAQLSALREAGCELMQGFLFCKPVPASAAAELMTTALGEKHASATAPDTAHSQSSTLPGLFGPGPVVA